MTNHAADLSVPNTLPTYRVWAPRAGAVRLHLKQASPDGTVPKTSSETCDLHPVGDGWWESNRRMMHGDLYAYSLQPTTEDNPDSPNPDNAELWSKPLPDPRSRRQPEGPHGFSQVVDTASFEWSDAKNGRTPWTGRPIEGSVLYELHVGTFAEDGTFAGVVDKLDHLVDLGITHVELMPVQPFGGNRNWGYDGVSWHAVHEQYGGPEGLAALVDTCHTRGLAVVLDVVFNHFGPDGNYVGMFAPYTAGGNTGWGEVVNLNAPGSDEVRDYILDAVRMWLSDYRIDALRIDAVHALHDTGAFHILEQMQHVAETVAAETGVPRSLIAESDQNDPRLVRARSAGGYGLAAQWDDDVHHALHCAVSGENHAYYADFGSLEVLATTLQRVFWHDGRYSSFRGRRHGRPVHTSVQPTSAFVTYTTTHDQVGNRASGDRPSMNLTPAQQVLKAAVLMSSPFTPMLFQGEEWGASTPFAFFCSHEDEELLRLTREGRMREFSRSGWDPKDIPNPAAEDTFHASRLQWAERETGTHPRIMQAYRQLIALRRQGGALSNPWMATTRVRFSEDDKWLRLDRGISRTMLSLEPGASQHSEAENPNAQAAVALAANFSDQTVTVPLDGVAANPNGVRKVLWAFADEDAGAGAGADAGAGAGAGVSLQADSIVLPPWASALVTAD